MPLIKDILLNQSFHCLTDDTTISHTFYDVYATDLISMVIKHGKNEPILITQIVTKSTLAVAIMLNLPAVILCENKTFSKSLINRANDEGIAVINTSLTAVEVVIEMVRMSLL